MSRNILEPILNPVLERCNRGVLFASHYYERIPIFSCSKAGQTRKIEEEFEFIAI